MTYTDAVTQWGCGLHSWFLTQTCGVTQRQIIEDRVQSINIPELSRTIPNYNTSERFRTVQWSLRIPHVCPRDGSQRATDRSRDKIVRLRRELGLPQQGLGPFTSTLTQGERRLRVLAKFLPVPSFGQTFCHDFWHCLGYIQLFLYLRFTWSNFDLWQLATDITCLTTRLQRL